MEYRRLNGSGLFVPALTLGTGTFGGSHGFEGLGAYGSGRSHPHGGYVPRSRGEHV